MALAPKQSVMHEQKLRTGGDRHAAGGHTGVNGRSDALDSTAVLDLQPVNCSLVILKRRRAQQSVAMNDHFL